VSTAERVRSSEADAKAAVGLRQRHGGAVDQHLATPGLDLVAKPLEQRLPAPARVPETLAAGFTALDLPPQGQLLPKPGHRDLLGAVAELAPQQRPPDLLPGLLPHRADDPVVGCLALELGLLRAAPLQPQHG
jgi:hypothetical protein